jgi:hypothetical protein
VDSGRLEAFSDGVFAVAITLLALNLAIGGPVPHGPTLAAKLTSHWSAFATYAVSFATIGIIWVNHHALFRNFSQIDRTLLFVNLLLLFWRAIRCAHPQVTITPQQARQATIPFGIGNLGYITGIGIAFASAQASLAISGVVAAYYIFEHTPAREQPQPDHSDPAAAADSTSQAGPGGHRA